MPNTEDVIKWTNKYKEKVGKDFFEDWDRDFYPLIYIHDDGSLFAYTFLLDRLEIGVFSGNVAELYPVVVKLTKEAGLNKIATVSPFNPRAYERLTKSNCTDFKCIDGVTYYYFVKEIDNG